MCVIFTTLSLSKLNTACQDGRKLLKVRAKYFMSRSPAKSESEMLIRILAKCHYNEADIFFNNLKNMRTFEFLETDG